MNDIVETMNECFQTVFTRENGFEDLNLESHDRAHGTGLERIQTSPGEIRKLLLELDVRKSTGPDGVSSWVLKECNQHLTGKLCDLYNESLAQGKMPKDWKRAEIVPLYKGGSKEDSLNYRPVSLTSVVVKV